jgi:hypothetical protein
LACQDRYATSRKSEFLAGVEHRYRSRSEALDGTFVDPS